MREIKFKREHFDNLGNHVGSTEWGKLDRGYFASPSTMSDADETKAIDRQYTGLKDKNGVEIYEGGILARKYEPDRHGEVYPPVLATAEYITDGFKFVFNERDLFSGARKTIELRYWNQKIEVIGNIYENPELLGDKTP